MRGVGCVVRQLFEAKSFTYTYIIACSRTKKAVIIDPVDVTVDRDARVLADLGLELVYAVNTHVHADHVTGTHLLRSKFEQIKTGLGSAATDAKSDLKFDHGHVLEIGDVKLEVRHTPGHTAGCVSYVEHDSGLVFTGDALFIRGCGRTDFQGGSAATLFRSVHEQILSLPADFVIFPAHDYKGETRSTVEEEKRLNPRLTKSLPDFVTLMDNLNLSYPKMIDVALPLNLNCGAEPLPK